MIDSHCHLDFPQFDNQRDDLVKEAVDKGVHTILNIGVDIPTSLKSINLANKHESIYAVIGVHPHDAKKVLKDYLTQLADMSKNNKVVAVGEIGLDYYHDHSPREVQRKIFQEQLELAVELQLPVVIHSRESFEDTCKILIKYSSKLKGGVFHCFPGSSEDAFEVIDFGFHISVGGIITFKKSTMSKVASEVPLDKIILETDAPYLAPVPYRGKTNHPSYVKYVGEKMAELKGISYSEVEKITDRTCQKLFNLVETFGG